MKIDFDPKLWDFRLLDVSAEIYALEDHLQLVEKQIESMQQAERDELTAYIQKEKLTSNDPEWHEANQNFNHRFDFLLPRVFRGPFIVVLYAVYETSVIEIARLLQKSMGQSISLGDLRGNFLDRSKKYFEHILKFDLCNDKEAWERIKIMSDLRHALAHANGRLEMLKEESLKQIKSLEKKRIGIVDFDGYIVFNAEFTKETFRLVRSSLEDLVDRYKCWDSDRQK